MFWTPKWKKEAKLIIKGSKKFINYKRDLLEKEHVKNILSRQQDVKEAIAGKDPAEVKKKCNLLEQECKRSLSNYVRPNWLSENTEIIFVAIVVALGLRAYYLQPFRIPTGSMQPTLNGINGHALEQDKWPSLPVRLAQYATHGRSYISVIAEKDVVIEGIQEFQSLKFLTKCNIVFSDGSFITVSASKAALMDLIARTSTKAGSDTPKDSYTTGEVIAQGFVDSGDLVLVDKMSYHFRKPTRGETFVFDTRNINEIHTQLKQVAVLDQNGSPILDSDGSPVTTAKMVEQEGGSHYIKRCVGVPGDTLSIDANGNLIVNGKIAKDPGIQYAMNIKYNKPQGQGYSHADPPSSSLYKNPLVEPGQELVLKGEDARQKAEYAAFGDNTKNSLDSRYWGAVKQYNLVGPALISLWPFSHEIDPHWGIIK